MSQTSHSLLARLRDPADGASWRRMVDLYTPMILGWMRRHLHSPDDCQDLAQEVLTVVVRRFPEFQHNQRPGAFRAWLRTITANCMRDFWRSRRARPHGTGDSDFQEMLSQLEDPGSGLSALWNKEHDLYVTRRLLEMIQPRFSEATWSAFERVALRGESAETVARELKLSVNAVFIAKSRVLAALRQEAEGLLDTMG